MDKAGVSGRNRVNFAAPLLGRFPQWELRPTIIFRAKSTAKTGRSTDLPNCVMSNTSDQNTTYGMMLKLTGLRELTSKRVRSKPFDSPA